MSSKTPFSKLILGHKIENSMSCDKLLYIRIGSECVSNCMRIYKLKECFFLCVNGCSLIEKGLNLDLKLDRGR